jgi:hypothetical protein
MIVQLNQIISTEKEDDFIHWNTLTKGRHEKGYNLYKGMPYNKEARGIVPSINFHINPFKENSKETPWRDMVFQDEGRVIYNGDNKSADNKASDTDGNKVTLSVIKHYNSKDEIDRHNAPPIIVTRTIKIKGKTGYREFIGFGIIASKVELVQQYEKDGRSVFSNYQYEVTLFKLQDGELFDWDWIDDRRDESIQIEESNQRAPLSWRKWIKEGNKCLPEVRLRIKRYHLMSIKEQKEMPLQNNQLLTALLNKHYPNPIVDGIRFEAMASFIASCFFKNHNYLRGWITQGSADKGVDFVGRLKIGDSGISQTSLIVLGQSKRYKSQISGEKVTRIASRMTRGYIGIVVTLGTISIPAQKEIHDDKLPIILINGRKVTELLLTYINEHQISLEELVKRQDEWALLNMGSDDYNSVLEL